MRKIYHAQQTLEIECDARTCYDVICDFERYPEWFRNVKKVIVKTRNEEGVPKVIHFLFDIAIKKNMQIVLEYDFFPENTMIEFRQVGGDVAQAKGFYKFGNLYTGNTLAVFEVDVDPGMVFPARIVNYLIDVVMKNVLVMLKEYVESKKR